MNGRTLLGAALLGVLSLGLWSQGSLADDKAKQIAVKGSDTMILLGQAWAEAFTKAHPDMPVTVTGGGSGTGIAALEDGSCDVAQASRNVKDKERAKIEKATGKKLKEIPVAIDALVVAVNPENKVPSLTFEQLSGIFQGKITNWKDVGGADGPIVALSRERNSGTHVYFLEHVVRLGNEKGPEEYGSDVLMLPTSQGIVDQVASNKNAIGYYGLGYLSPKNRAVPVAKKKDEKPVAASFEAAVENTYPIARSLFFYTAGEPTGAVKTFVEFALSDDGQKIVKKMDFVPVKKAQD